METPDPFSPALGGDDAPDPLAPVLGGLGAPPPPPLYRKGRNLEGLKAQLGLYLSKPGATGYVPDFSRAEEAARRIDEATRRADGADASDDRPI